MIKICSRKLIFKNTSVCYRSLLRNKVTFWGKYRRLQLVNYKKKIAICNLQKHQTYKMAQPTIYRSIESVVNVLTNYKRDNVQAVSSLLQIYNHASKIYEEECKGDFKKHPLIILEGLDGSGKSTVGKKLATRLHAASWSTPPQSIKHIRHLFDDHPQLRTAYYALGNYIAALEVAVELKKQPVVMDRYWHSTAVYAIAQAVHDSPEEVEMPPEGDSFYHWPSDLMKPDAVVFLNVSEHVRIQRLSRRTTITSQEEMLKTSSKFRNNIIMGYRNMVCPEVTFINADGGFNSTLKRIDDKIEHLFK